ncbi:MAG: alpha/beta hydrolase [Pseudomonadota bacterium]
MKIGILVGLVFLVVLIGLWTFELMQRAADDRAFPPPGHFVSHGDRQLHVQCAGTSNGVTIMLEAGAGASSLDWEVVAAGLAEQTRVCRYDRAGFGWSDRGPWPRSIEALVDDLHHVITHETGDDEIVLAGHSFGGLIVQAYARTHPDRLRGLVIVDGVDTDFIELYAEQSISGARTMRLGAVVTHIGLPRLLGMAPAPTSAPDRIQRAMKARIIRPASIATAADEAVSVGENVPYLRALATLDDDLPVTVLSRRTDGAVLFDQDWEAAQRRLATLNSQTKRIVSTSSDHQLPFTDPDLVVSEVMALAAPRT